MFAVLAAHDSLSLKNGVVIVLHIHYFCRTMKEAPGWHRATSQQKNPHYAQGDAHHVTTPAHPSFRACHDSDHDRAPFPENTSFFRGMGDYSLTQRVKGYYCGSLWSCACRD